MLLVSEYGMKGFLVPKIVQIERSGNIERIIKVDTLVHLLPKDRNEFNRLSDRRQGIDITHALAITPEVSMENKHVDSRCCSDNLNVIIDHLVLRGECEVLTIEEHILVTG